MNEIIFQNTISYIKEYFVNYEHRNMIIEPLSCIFRIMLLLYHPEGTKLSIEHNSISYNEPNMFQGIYRFINKDKRGDLHNLYNPLCKSFEWYPVSNRINVYFYKQCIEGFNKLLISYENESIVCHTIKHYISLLEECLEQRDIPRENDKIESPLLDTLKEVWKTNEIEVMFKMFKLLEDETIDNTAYLHTINQIIHEKEKMVYTLINKYSSSYN